MDNQYNEGYYRFIQMPVNPSQDELFDEDFTSEDIGDLFYLIEVKDDQVQLLWGESYYYLSHGLFVECFEWEPNGAAERSLQMAEALQNLHNDDAEQGKLLVQAATPAIEYDGEDSEDSDLKSESDTTEVSASGDLMLVGGGRSAEDVKHALKTVKTQVAKVRTSIKARQSELKRFVEEQRIIMERKMGTLKKQIKKAEAAIDVISIYLGTHEEIHRIKKGNPAPAEKPIVLRQSVLYMDEEAALARDKYGKILAETGGVDFRKVQDFDRWIKKPNNLNTCMPETKGIVAFRVRRHGKQYGGYTAWEQAEANQLNNMLYILIRNGTNVWRIWTNLELGSRLFPETDEWESYFYDYDGQPLKPGSRKYMEAMDQAEENQRQYMKVLFMIQGMLDRTKVFHPLPVARVNVCNLDHYNKYLQFIYDAENLLGDGRPSFKDWHAAANAQLEKGCRIIGSFGSYYHEWSGSERCYPKHCSPTSHEIYTIEEKKQGAFIIRWKRTDEVYSWTKGFSEPKRRANMKLYKTDGFILNIDAVDVEEMEYYLTNRLHRHEYLKLVPLLLTAIRIKRKESQEEEPFRQLLIGEIMKEHDVDLDTAEGRIDELISWWKFKNRTHRALICGDDSKAIRMIVGEYGRRKKLYEQQEDRAVIHEEVCKLLHARDSESLLAIFHRRDNLYVALHSHNDENVFVREEHWRIRGSDSELIRDENKEWRIIDSRNQSWKLLWKHDRLDSWKIGARPENYLTDPEKEQWIQATIDAVNNVRKERKKKGSGAPWNLPILVVSGGRYHSDKNMCAYFASHHALLPDEKHLLTSRCEAPHVKYVAVGWKKSANGTVEFGKGDLRDPTHFHSRRKFPWDKDYEDTFGDKSDCIHGRPVIWRNDENQALLKEEMRLYHDAMERRKKLGGPLSSLTEQLQKVLKDQWLQRKQKEYLEEYVEIDEELFEEWLNKNRGHRDGPGWPNWIAVAAGYLVECGEEVNGKTVEHVMERAIELGFNKMKEEWYEDEDSEYAALKDVVLQIDVDMQDEWD